MSTIVTIAQALASSASNLDVVDSGGNIAAALPNAALLARVHAFTLNANATLNAASAEKLGLLGAKFQLGGQQLAVRDTLAAIGSAANAAGVALASVRQVADAAYNLLNAPAGSFAHASNVILLGAPTLNVAQYARLEALPGFAVDPSTHLTVADSLTAVAGLLSAHPAWFLPVAALSVRLDGSAIGAYAATEIATLEGHGTSVSFVASGQSAALPVTASAQDLASNAAGLNHLAGQVALHFTLTNEGATLSAAQAAALAGLHGFNPALHALYVVDSGAAITQAATSLFGHGFTEIVVSSGTLTGNAAMLLNPQLHLDGGASCELTASATLGAAQAASLLALPGFHLAANTSLNVDDTISALAANAGGLAGASTVTVTDSETVSAADAATLAALAHAVGAGFSLGIHTMAVADTAADLLNLPQSALAIISGSALSANATVDAVQFATLRDSLHVVLAGHVLTIADSAANLLALSGSLALAGACVVSASATITAAQDSALAALPDASTGDGVVLTVTDSAANLLALPAPARALAGGFALNNDATVTAGQFTTLRDTLHVGMNGHALTVMDTAAGLLSLAGGDLSRAAACVLDANATVSGSQALALSGEPDFSTGGHVLTISDSAGNLLALPESLQLLASSLALAGGQTVTAAQLTALAGLGITFSTAGHTLTVADTASALEGLSAPAVALASAEVLDASATVTAAAAASLASLPHFSVAPEATLTVQDSAANLLALPPAALAVAGAERLAPGAVTLTAAQAAGLGGMAHFSATGATITVADTVADLIAQANAGWQNVAAAVQVTDSAAVLAADAPTGLLQSAAAVILSGNAQIGVAQAVALETIPHFSLGTAQLTVLGTAAAIAAQAPAVAAVASLVEVTDSGPISAAQADQLATLANAGTLVFLGGSQLQIADSYAALTAGANAAGVALAARLTVSDSGATIALAAAHDWGAVNPSYVLSANSQVSAAQAGVLAGLGAYFSEGPYALVCTDTVANLLALTAPAQALLAGELVTQSATIDAATMDGLAARPGFGVAGNAVLTVQDSAASLLGLTPAAVAAASIVALGANATVSAAQFLQLRDFAHVQLDGHVLTVSDSAANLAALTGSLALAGACVMTGNATLDAAQATALAGEPGISTGGYTLTISDNATALAALQPDALALAAGEVLNQSATVNLATLADLASLPALTLGNGVTLTVQDSASNLLALTQGELALASACVLSGDSVATVAQAVALAAEPGFSLGGHVLTVIGTASALLGMPAGVVALAGAEALTNPATLDAADATTLAARPNVSLGGGVVLTVQDTAAALLALPSSVQALAGAYLLSADATVDAAQLQTLRDTLHVGLGGHALTVSDNAADLLLLAGGDLSLASACVLSQDADVTAAQATALAGEPAFSAGGHALTISDSAANLLGLTAPVQALAGALVLAGDQTVSAAQLTGLAGLGGAFNAGGHVLTVTDNAANLVALGAPALALAAAEILGQSTVVSAATAAALTTLPNIILGDGVSLVVNDTAAALLGLSPAVTALANGYELSANATVNAAEFTTLRDTLDVSLNLHQLTIADSATNLLGLAGENLSLASACVLNANATVGYAQAEALAGEPGFSTGGHMLTVADSAVNLLSLPQNVLAVAVVLELNGDQFVGTDQLAGLVALGSQFTAHGYVIAVQGTATELLALTAPELALVTGEFLSQSAIVTAAQASLLAAHEGLFLDQGVTLTVDDTAAALLALPAPALAIGAGYELAANATVDANDFLTLRDTLGISLNGHVLTLADSAANLLNLAGGDLSLAGACLLTANATVSVANALILGGEPGFSAGANVLTISDSSAAITANLATLQADFGGFGAHLAITLTDPQPAITVNAATYFADRSILDAVTNPAPVTVADNAANIAAAAPALAADAHVGQVAVTDSAVDVVENLTNLLPLGARLAVTLTDQAPLAASLVPFLVQLDQVTCGVGVSDTASQIASVVEQADSSGNPAAIIFLESNGVSLSGDSEVSVADLAALEQLGGNLNLNGHSIYVYDTAAHLSTSSAAIALATAENDGLIAGAYVKAPGGVLTVNAATATTLFTVDGINQGAPPPQGGSVAITVADTAANIDTHYATLADLLLSEDISGVLVTASATISDAALGDLQALGAAAGANVALIVHDSAATIAQNAAFQGSAQSILPAGWVLNGNATISEAQAVVLGGLAHFSTGGYSITLNLNANTVISIADANALGTIASALNLNNHELLVAGNVAQLSALSPQAQALVVPELTDTLTNITALGAASPLLAGSVTVSDSETITAAQAASFLGLIASDGGPGIAAGQLNFGGHTENVTGSVAQLQALATSTAWTNSTAVHGAFALTASDSVANLINSANTSFLSGLHATTLSGNAVLDAADAETLAGLEARINFNAGGHALTVQDSADNLVALQNAAGLAIAGSVVMDAPATLDAFDAETLLSNAHLALNAPLTIQDNSANLLDGTLLTDIVDSGAAAQIHVQLAGPETLDAETAASLVALPSFDDTHNLTIADSSAYLLASANLAAEDHAVAVTLAGDETVSANTVLRLSEVPHFTVGNNQLTLAGNDFADAATLKAIADLGTHFSDGGHTITATADALDLTPTEYTALQSDGVLANGHAISAVLVNDHITDINSLMALTATGVAGATVNIYDSAGNLLSATPEANSGFTVTAADSGMGHAYSITEVVNGTESAPVVVLEANLIEAAVTTANASFAASGAIEVDSGKYLNLYSSTNVPQNLQTAALVYNATTHTISLDLPNAAAVTLITLGASTHPASLDVSEILVKHHG